MSHEPPILRCGCCPLANSIAQRALKFPKKEERKQQNALLCLYCSALCPLCLESYQVLLHERVADTTRQPWGDR